MKLYNIFLFSFILFSLNKLQAQDNEINKYELLISKFPDDQSNYLKLADLYQKNNDIENVNSVFDRMIIVWPENAMVYYRWALNLSHMKCFDSSISKYMKSLEIESDHPNVLYNFAISLANLKRFDEAISAIDKAYTLEPEDRYLNFKNKLMAMKQSTKQDVLLFNKVDKFNLAVQLFNQGQINDALIAVNEFLRVDSTYLPALYMQGSIYLDQKKYQLAKSSFIHILRIDNKYYKAYFCLGMIYFYTKKMEKAFECFYLSFSDPEIQEIAIHNCDKILDHIAQTDMKLFNSLSGKLLSFIELTNNPKYNYLTEKYN